MTVAVKSTGSLLIKMKLAKIGSQMTRGGLKCIKTASTAQLLYGHVDETH